MNEENEVLIRKNLDEIISGGFLNLDYFVAGCAAMPTFH